MGNGSSSGTLKGWLAAGVTAVIAIGVGWYWCHCKPCPPPVEPDPNLIIEDDDIASWMPINNTFTITYDNNGNANYDRDLRAGLLVQIGGYQHGEIDFGSVELKKNGTTVATLTDKDFTWINVVSPWTNNEKPMDPGSHEFVLYPNNVYAHGPCEKVDACAGQAFKCNNTDQGALVPGCLRQRLLHTDFNFKAILTYWQGANGLTGHIVQAAPVHSGPRVGQKRNTYDFTFKDGSFTVDVYNYPSNQDTAPVKSFNAGEVTQIVIKTKLSANGPGNGDHQSPPWPPPTP